MSDVHQNDRDSAPQAGPPDLPASGIGEKLDWNAFSARHFPGRSRHDLDAVTAYGAYKRGLDWRKDGVRTTQPRLTLVPNDSAPAAIEADPEGPILELVAVAAEQVWKGEDGLTR